MGVPFKGHALVDLKDIPGCPIRKTHIGWEQILLFEEGFGRRMDLVGQNKREIFKDACWPESYVLPSIRLLHWSQHSKIATKQSCYTAPILAPNWHIKTAPQRL